MIGSIIFSLILMAMWLKAHDELSRGLSGTLEVDKTIFSPPLGTGYDTSILQEHSIEDEPIIDVLDLPQSQLLKTLGTTAVTLDFYSNVSQVKPVSVKGLVSVGVMKQNALKFGTLSSSAIKLAGVETMSQYCDGTRIFRCTSPDTYDLYRQDTATSQMQGMLDAMRAAMVLELVRKICVEGPAQLRMTLREVGT